MAFFFFKWKRFCCSFLNKLQREVWLTTRLCWWKDFATADLIGWSRPVIDVVREIVLTITCRATESRFNSSHIWVLAPATGRFWISGLLISQECLGLQLNTLLPCVRLSFTATKAVTRSFHPEQIQIRRVRPLSASSRTDAVHRGDIYI